MIRKRKKLESLPIIMAIQILQYEFLGPIGLSEWGPPMDKVVYIIFTKNKEVFNMLYVGESDKTEELDFFTKNPKFKCWISHAGNEENIYLSIYPMWESSESERLQLAQKIVNKYGPICNQAVDDSQN
tara:strand:+ start:68 stop:451 length:384 start_codon:yes stop_codon:yes gene_type:complete